MSRRTRSRRDVITVDPRLFGQDNTFVTYHAVSEDTYFQPEPQDSALGNALDALVDSLTDVERQCVELKVFASMSYREIAEVLDLTTGNPPFADKKQAWRVTQRALRKLRREINQRPWLVSIARNQHPFEEEN